nr:hypothetical protein [Tanacetum cinerariifolium]
YDDDDNDEDEEDSSGDEAGDVEEDEDEDKEEKEEHPPLADSIPPSLVHRVTARMSIREQPPIPVWSEVEIDRLVAIPSPPPSPLSPWSSPLPQIPSPPLPVSSPLTVLSPPLPVSPTYPLGYRFSMIRLRAETPSTSRPRYEVGESSAAAAARPTGGFREDYGFVATLDGEIRRDPKREVGGSTAFRDCEVAGGRPQETSTIH